AVRSLAPDSLRRGDPRIATCTCRRPGFESIHRRFSRPPTSVARRKLARKYWNPGRQCPITKHMTDAPAAVAHPAATVILLREAGGGFEVLLLPRHAQLSVHRGAPGVSPA